MSGLLHRLSDLAINGTVSRVRPLPPNPWLPTPEPAVPLGERGSRTSFLTGSSDTPAPPSARASRHQDDATAPDTAARRSPFALPGSGAARPMTPRDDVGPAAVGESVPTRPAPVVAFQPLPPDATAPTETTSASEASPAGVAPDDRATADSSTPQSAHARIMPAPLIPVPAAASTVHVEYRDGGPGLRAAQPSEPVTEVHVRIARVELTAVVEPPAPQPKSRTAPPGRSLDEYLQQRNERRG